MKRVGVEERGDHLPDRACLLPTNGTERDQIGSTMKFKYAMS